MAVEVYVWLQGFSKTIVSHAALSVDGGSPYGKDYLSAWPKDNGLVGAFFATVIGQAEYRTPEMDLQVEGKPLTVRLTRLDETSIKKKIQRFKSEKVYSFLLSNCAQQAGACLNAGIPAFGASTTPSLLPSDLSGMPFDTPANLWLYANTLKQIYG